MNEDAIYKIRFPDDPPPRPEPPSEPKPKVNL